MAKRHADQITDENWRGLVELLLDDANTYLTGCLLPIDMQPDGWPTHLSPHGRYLPRGIPPNCGGHLCCRCRVAKAARGGSVCKGCLAELTAQYGSIAENGVLDENQDEI